MLDRELSVDEVMLAEYDDLQQQVSDRKLITLELKQERDLVQLLENELERLKIYVNRVENERDYYQSAAAFQGP